MLRLLIPTLVVVATLSSAHATEPASEGTVEIVRGTRAVQPKVIEVAPEPEAKPKGEQAAKSSKDKQPQSSDEDTRELQQRQLEELSRQTREAWRQAGNALAGE